MCIAVLNKLEQKLIFVNIYAPNDHKIQFYASVFHKIIDIQASNPRLNNV